MGRRLRLAYGSVNEGLFVLPKDATEAENKGKFPVLCLTWEQDGLYGCSAPNLCGPFLLGRSTDNGQTFSPVVETADIGGDQTDCAAGTPGADTCPARWSGIKRLIGSCELDGGAPDAPPLPASWQLTSCDCSLGRSEGGPKVLALGLLGALAAVVRRASRSRSRSTTRGRDC